jgi:CRP/FNR family transcriptional regulator, anaerobic regulatory protein
MKQRLYRFLREKAQMTDEHVSALLDYAISKQYAKGQFLLTKGQVCSHYFFVETGLLRFYSVDEEGKEHIVQFAPENWFVSDRGSIFFREPSEYFIDTIEDTYVVLIDHHFIEQAYRISPEFRGFNDHLLQNHIRHLQNRINLLIGASAEKRYLEFIRLYPDLTLRVPQWMIASYLGITPESLSRVRKELARRNYRPAP